jgi:putative spermidine/putrescine transport system substrate-binding protein
METEMSSALSRRKFLIAAGTATTALSLGGGFSPARAEDKFTMSSAGGTWGQFLRTSFVEGSDFAKMDIAYEEGGDSVRLSKLIASRSNPAVSVINFLTPEQMLAGEANCVQAYDPDIVTNLKNIYPAALTPPIGDLKNWGAAFSIAATGLVYNNKEVTAAPKSWNDLWNPKYKGKIGIPDYGWIGISWIHALNRDLGGNEDNLDPAIKALIDLRKKNNAIVIGSTDQASKALASGEIVMLPWFNGRAFEMQEKGLPIDVAYVKNSVVQTNGFLIPKGTRFQKEANQLVQRSLSPECQVTLCKLSRYAPANKEVKLPTEFERYAIPPAALEASAPLDWGKVNKYRAANLKRWTEEVLG